MLISAHTRSNESVTLDRAFVGDARQDDINGVVGIHKAAFPEFFLTRLGSRFLRLYYQSVTGYSGGILRIAVLAGQPVGFVAGFADPPQFYQHLRCRRVPLVLAVVPRLILRPWLLPRLLLNYRRTGVRSNSSNLHSSELASLAVLPQHQGRSIGRALVDDFVRISAERGARTVVLTTDANGNDRVNRFYARYGFCLSGTLKIQDRLLNEYLYRIPSVSI